MPRNRHKRYQQKAPSPILQQPAGKPSPAAQRIMERVANGGVAYLRESMIRVMTDSVKLADEPEFIDLALDSNQAAQITQRWFQKYEKRLIVAQRQSPDEHQQVFDDMRIKIIGDLATPAFRKEVKHRLQALFNRLIETEDPDQLEIILLLQPMLSMKEIPWGLCGLILTIYNRAMEQAMQEHKDEQEILDALNEALKGEGEAIFDFDKVMESPEKLERAEQKMFAGNPGLRERAEKQVWDMIEKFEGELAKGKITLNLFTEEELLLPFERLQEEFGQAVTEMQPSDEFQHRTFNIIVQVVEDILTPERFQRLRNDVEATAKVWMRERQKWGAALQFEASLLEGEAYEKNKFVLSAFLGQLYLAGKEQKPAPKKKKRKH